MNRYIDADKLAYMVACNGDADFINKATKQMIEAPSIDIVRCKECKHWICNPNTEKWGKCKWISDKQFDVVMNADDYCSYGEREGE